MNLFHEMTKKPWLVDPTEASSVREVGAFFLPAGKVGLRVFLVVVTVVEGGERVVKDGRRR